MLRDTFVEVDLGRLAHNIDVLRAHAQSDVMAVVKANAYGHGMLAVSKQARECGVRWFAVATADEAGLLRHGCQEARILILGPVQPKEFSAMVDAEIALCIFTPAQLFALEQAAAHAGRTAHAHVKTDTGMGRVGLRTPEEMDELLRAAACCPHVRLEGLFTHFATADEADKTFARGQLARFNAFAAQMRAAGFSPLCHAANSAAILSLPEARLDLARMGISMYGYPPSGEVGAEMPLLPVMSFYSHISHIKTIHAGESVSYGRTFTAEGPRRIATVAVGYADGYRRAWSNKAHAMVGGVCVPQVGRVCMDQIMLDVTDAPAAEGDRVLLMGDAPGMTADDLAALADTISYEILTGISARVERIYV